MTLRCALFDFRNLAFRNREVDNPLRASNLLSVCAKCTQQEDNQERNAVECRHLSVGGHVGWPRAGLSTVNCRL